MQHRHLNHQRFTLAGIDDVICRGHWQDWSDLRRAILQDPSLLGKIEQICRPQIADPYAQRYHFWMNYVEERRHTFDPA
jgi:hypothetical protein